MKCPEEQIHEQTSPFVYDWSSDIIKIFLSLSCINLSSPSPLAVHLRESAVIRACFQLCWGPGWGGKMLPQEGTCTTPSAVSGPTLRKQSIALQWCSCFPDSFSFVFHSPQKGASFSSRRESYTRHVDSNPFPVALRCCVLPLLLARLRDRSLGSVRTILS